MPLNLSIGCTGRSLCVNVDKVDDVRRGISCNSINEAQNRLKLMAGHMISDHDGALVVDTAVPCKTICTSARSLLCGFTRT